MPYLYAVLNVVVVSLTSAVIGLLPFAIGGFLKGKYKLVLFLPTYLLFYVLQIWEDLFSVSFPPRILTI